MKKILILSTIIFTFSHIFGEEIKSASNAQKIEILPRGVENKKALNYEYFPSRLHAFVFRNWSCVSKERMAKVLETSTANVQKIADEMSLPEQGKIEPQWDTTKGYITIARKNWHLIDYPQMLSLLNLSAEEFQYRLIEDDFLFVKMGNIKPICSKLIYLESSPEILEKAKEFSNSMKAAGIENLSNRSEKFTFLKEFDCAEKVGKRPLYDSDAENIKMAFSYFSEYGDPLLNSEIPSYPEGLLSELSQKGINAVWIHTVLRTLVADDGIFEGSADWKTRIENLNKLVARAKKYGIKIFIYLNEPRALPHKFFESSPARAALKGTVEGSLTATCTSKKEVLQWLENSVAKVFEGSPELGGVFTITASENLTNCLSRGKKICPVCKKRGAAEVIAEVNNTILKGIRRHSKTAKLIVWDWGWKEENVEETISKLDKDSTFISVSEIGLPIVRGGVKMNVNEYSISSVGPSQRSLNRWNFAKKCGLKTMAKVQVNSSWEFSAVPYLPLASLVACHAENLKKSGVQSALLSWSLGGYPSENIELFNTYDISKTREENLRAIAQKYYGKNAADSIIRAWDVFGKGFSEYPFHIATVYSGAHHWGAANPIYAVKTNWRATMVGIPYDDLKSWRSIYPTDVFIAQFRKISVAFAEGVKILKAIDASLMSKSNLENLRATIAYADTARIHFESVANQSEYIALRDSTPPIDKTRMTQILFQERDLAHQMLALASSDARIGYEASNHYFYTETELYEKFASIDYALKIISAE